MRFMVLLYSIYKELSIYIRKLQMNIKINPFNPNSTVSTNLFAGRKDQILRAISKLEQVKSGMPAIFFLSGDSSARRLFDVLDVMPKEEAKEFLIKGH